MVICLWEVVQDTSGFIPDGNACLVSYLPLSFILLATYYPLARNTCTIVEYMIVIT